MPAHKWATPAGSHVHCLPIDEGGTRLYPDGLCEYATDFPRRLPENEFPGGRYTCHSAHAHRNTDPDPPGSSRLHITRLQTPVPLRIPSRLAHRTRTIWQYWHDSTSSGPLATLPPRLLGSGCPQLHRTTVTVQRRRSFTSARNKQRLVAHMTNVVTLTMPRWPMATRKSAAAVAQVQRSAESG